MDSMQLDDWLALAAVLTTWIAGAAVVYAQLRVVASRVDGLSAKQEETTSSIRRLFVTLDSRPCERHAATLDHLTSRVDVLEENNTH